MASENRTFVDILGVLGRRFKVQEAVETSKLFGLLHRDTALCFEVGFVSYNANDCRGIGVVAELLEPLGQILKAFWLCNVKDEKCADGTAVVRARDGAISLLIRMWGTKSDGNEARYR